MNESAPQPQETPFNPDSFLRGINDIIDTNAENQPQNANYYDRMRGFADSSYYKKCKSRLEIISKIDERLEIERKKGSGRDQEAIDVLVDLKEMM